MKTTKFLALLLSIYVLIFSTSCVSLTGFQTAKALEVNQLQLIGSANVLGIEDGGLPLIEVGARYGITKNFDGGLKMSNFGSALLDFKYQFLGDVNSKNALAIGVGIGGGLARINVDGDDGKPNINFHIPFYASTHPRENIHLYLSPRFMVVNGGIFGEDFIDPIVSTTSYFGGNLGVLFGTKIQFGVDLGFYGSENAESIIQVGVGILGKI